MNKNIVEDLFAILLGGLLATAVLGMSVKEMREDERVFRLIFHRYLAIVCLVFYVLSIGATEWMVRTHGGEVESAFFPFHLFFAVVSLAAFILALRFNGNRKREWHRPLVYMCIGSYVIAFVLAVPLLRLF